LKNRSTRREHHLDGIAERIDEDVNLGGQSAAGSADRLLAVFLCTGAVLMLAHDGGIDHHVLVVVITGQNLENTLKNLTFRPIEALIDNLPIAKAPREIAPRDPGAKSIESRFDEQSIVSRSASDVTIAARQKVFDPIPLIVA